MLLYQNARGRISSQSGEQACSVNNQLLWLVLIEEVLGGFKPVRVQLFSLDGEGLIENILRVFESAGKKWLLNVSILFLGKDKLHHALYLGEDNEEWHLFFLSFYSFCVSCLIVGVPHFHMLSSIVFMDWIGVVQWKIYALLSTFFSIKTFRQTI